MTQRPRYCIGTLVILAAIAADIYYMIVVGASSLSLPCLISFFAMILGTVLVHSDPCSRAVARRFVAQHRGLSMILRTGHGKNTY